MYGINIQENLFFNPFERYLKTVNSFLLNQLLYKFNKRVLPISFLSLFCCFSTIAQVGTGFFNGAVFNTYSSVNAGALSGNNFAVTYTGTFATQQLASYTPGSLPANSGFPVTNPTCLELMGNGANRTALYTFTNNLARYSTLFLQDVDLNEIIRVHFFDASNTLVSTSDIIHKTISTANLPAVTTAANSFTVTGVTTDVNEPLISFTVNTTTVKSVRITQLSGQTSGTYEIFFGVLGIDHGDAPVSYGDAGHFPSTTLKLGTIAAEAESLATFSANANGDDAPLNATTIDDEDGVAIGSLSIGATSYSQSVTVANTTGANATLIGWIDFNLNGVFDASEASAAVTVSNGATSATLSWTGLSGLVAGQSFARFRIASNPAEITSSTGFAANGEVEDYAINISTTLPLHLLSFTAAAQERSVILNWNTAAEINFSHFQVERSTDGINFQPIALIFGRNSASNEYQYSDNTERLSSTVFYYRLKQFDIDGRFEYSRIVVVQMSNSSGPALKVSSSVNGQIMITFISPKPGKNVLQIFDASGRIVWSKSISIAMGTNRIVLTENIHQPDGIYFLSLQQNGHPLVERFWLH